MANFLHLWDSYRQKQVLLNVQDIVSIDKGFKCNGVDVPDGCIITLRGDLECMYTTDNFAYIREVLDNGGLLLCEHPGFDVKPPEGWQDNASPHSNI